MRSPTAAPTRDSLWFAAVKPPMYTVALTPSLVGAAAAYADTFRLSIPAMLSFLLFAVAAIAWVNLTNDVFDFDTGVDVHKRESVVNLLGANRRARNFVLLLATLILFLAFSLLATMSRYPSGTDFTVITLLFAAVLGGYLYQGPPFRLGYYGLGELITLYSWTMGVCAAYYNQIIAHPSTHAHLLSKYPTLASRLHYVLFSLLPSPSRSLLAAAVLVAYPTAIILFCSHFHQEANDRAAGKRSPIVRLGVVRAVSVLRYLLVFFVVLHILLFAVDALPWQVLAMVTISLRHVFNLAIFVSRFYKNLPVIRAAKYYAVKLQFVHGVFLTVGFCLVALAGST